MDIKVDVSDVTIKTERLILRPWKKSDLKDFFEYASTPGLGEMAGWPHHQSMETSRRVLQAFVSDKNVFAIVYRRNRKVIGSIGLHVSWANEDDRFKHLVIKDIGYALSKNYWGRGLTPEAVSAVIECCFDYFGIDALTCGHFKVNDQSRRVIEKCGFSFVMESTYFAKQLDMTIPDVKYILLKDAEGFT